MDSEPLDVDLLIYQLSMLHRRKTVNSLLTGNDSQCFTTQQYAERYHKVVHNDDPKFKDGWIRQLIELAPKHLKSVGCVEVKPGVWTKELAPCLPPS